MTWIQKNKDQKLGHHGKTEYCALETENTNSSNHGNSEKNLEKFQQTKPKRTEKNSNFPEFRPPLKEGFVPKFLGQALQQDEKNIRT